MKHLRTFSFLIVFLLAASSLAGCELFGNNDEEPLDPVEGVVVGNSGNFGDQNGFVTVYDPVTQQAVHLPDLGAFVQSLGLHEERAYVTLNTFSTGRLAVLDLTTNQQIGQIEDLPSPRYIAFTEEKGYVTNLVFGGPGLVSVIDLETQTIVGDPIEVGASPEGIVALEGRVYVANYGLSGDGTTLSVIDAASDEVTGSIELGCDGPKHVFVDDEGELAVVCTGKTVYNEDFTEIIEQTNGQVIFVNPETEAVVARLSFDRQVGSANATQGAYYAEAAEELYVIDGTSQVVRIDTDANSQEATLTVPEAADLTGLTAVAYDAAAQHLYLGRLARGAGGPDYTSAGAVVLLDRAGTPVGRFTAGPAPAHIEFE